MDWLAEAMCILRDELPNIEVSVSSEYCRDLARALLRGKLDLAFIHSPYQPKNVRPFVGQRTPG
jgi:LysR family transcriptional regulator, hca operon transcriptional activator